MSFILYTSISRDQTIKVSCNNLPRHFILHTVHSNLHALYNVCVQSADSYGPVRWKVGTGIRQNQKIHTSYSMFMTRWWLKQCTHICLQLKIAGMAFHHRLVQDHLLWVYSTYFHSKLCILYFPFFIEHNFSPLQQCILLISYQVQTFREKTFMYT